MGKEEGGALAGGLNGILLIRGALGRSLLISLYEGHVRLSEGHARLSEGYPVDEDGHSCGQLAELIAAAAGRPVRSLLDRRALRKRDRIGYLYEDRTMRVSVGCGLSTV